MRLTLVWWDCKLCIWVIGPQQFSCSNLLSFWHYWRGWKWLSNNNLQPPLGLFPNTVFSFKKQFPFRFNSIIKSLDHFPLDLVLLPLIFPSWCLLPDWSYVPIMRILLMMMILAYHGATHPLRQRRESKAEGPPDTATAGVGEPFTAFDCTSKQTTFQVSQDRCRCWVFEVFNCESFRQSFWLWLSLSNWLVSRPNEYSRLNLLRLASGHFVTSVIYHFHKLAFRSLTFYDHSAARMQSLTIRSHKSSKFKCCMSTTIASWLESAVGLRMSRKSTAVELWEVSDKSTHILRFFA